MGEAAASFHLHNFGCRANQAEGAVLARRLAAAGLAPAPPEQAAWIVLNTCTVTAEAEAEARRALRRLRRRNPAARIAVTGCYAERAPAEVAALDGVTLVAGNRDKAALPGRLAGHRLPILVPVAAASPLGTRPFVQVQTGCGRACSYCIVPAVRGASRSRALGEVVAEVEALARSGAPEVVLSGINLGQWGRDRGAELTLATLLDALLRQTRIPRLRLSSIEPADWSPRLLALLVAHAPRFARHLHLPLQSGSASVLRRMRRRYRPRDYAALVETIARAVPGCALGADVMTGFPGEGEVEFEQTHALLASLPLAYLHVFPFSPRPGTEAARRLEAGTWAAAPPQVIAARAARLRELDRQLRRRFRASQAGLRLEAVALAGSVALTDNYLELPLLRPAPPGARVWLEVPGAAT